MDGLFFYVFHDQINDFYFANFFLPRAAARLNQKSL